MGFTTTLYYTSDDPKVVDKTLTGGYSVACAPYDGCSILAPRLILDYNSSAFDSNYLYIPEFGNRYYYITDVEVTPAQKMIISAKVDPLKTYSSQIRNCIACVTRSESIGKPTFIVDNKLPVDPNRKELKSILFTPGTNYWPLTGPVMYFEIYDGGSVTVM